MNTRLLILHWNELSIPQSTSYTDLDNNPYWSALAIDAFNTFQKAREIRSDCRISFSKGLLHGQIANRPLQSWMDNWLGRDRWRKLRLNSIQPTAPTHQPTHTLDCELQCNGIGGEGLTRAYISDSWAWSLATTSTHSNEHKIDAKKTSIEQEPEREVEVKNLASEKHVAHWTEKLGSWGEQLSNNHVIANIDRYIVVMYPLDHGHPHIHIRSLDDAQLNAKYRIDEFEPLTNKQSKTLDQTIQRWVERNHTLLTQSWTRCSAGNFPLKVTD